MIESSGPDWLEGLLGDFGAPGAGLAIALENLFPPLPSEVILPLAGFAASTGQMNLYAALVWTTAGSVAGALALYGAGAALGRARIHRLASRVPLVKVHDVERAEAWFARHGTKAVLLGRMIPLFRSLISIPAGIERMPLPLFLGLTTLGSALWNTAFITAGYTLGERWPEVTDFVSVYSKGVLILAAAAVAAFALIRILKPGRGRRRGPTGGESPPPPQHRSREPR
ncbi:DedA family protein [Streptomyces physcomitrii]|uniref:DedA family protein n=1 Tax=Streptomyces physcomitrii TaxID=2724184 RepID=A0ABX1H400_9ACTN|nr:DedA family protein [Streptomyces physcomitrii]NKI43089.1 DedA family protein [Streptomyces physcomitrii]